MDALFAKLRRKGFGGTPPATVDTLPSCSLSLRERAGVRAPGFRCASTL